jgi:hypothetical protein
MREHAHVVALTARVIVLLSLAIGLVVSWPREPAAAPNTDQHILEVGDKWFLCPEPPATWESARSSVGETRYSITSLRTAEVMHVTLPNERLHVHGPHTGTCAVTVTARQGREVLQFQTRKLGSTLEFDQTP